MNKLLYKFDFCETELSLKNLGLNLMWESNM